MKGKAVVAVAALMLAACVHILPEVAAEFQETGEAQGNRYLPPAVPVLENRGEDVAR